MSDPVSDLRAALADWSDNGDDCYQCNSDVRVAARVLLDALPEMLVEAEERGIRRGAEHGARTILDELRKTPACCCNKSGAPWRDHYHDCPIYEAGPWM